MDANLRRLAPLSGVIFVALYVIATIIGMSDSPDFAGTSQEITEYYVDKKDEILVSTVIAAIATPFYIWFLGCLRSAIARVEGGTTRLASTAFGAGIAAGAAGVGGVMVNAMGALRVDEQDAIAPATATAYYDIGQILAFAATPALIAAGLAATAVAALRYRAILPAWLAYLTIVLAIIDVIPPISWLGILIGLVWILVVSGLFYTQHVADRVGVVGPEAPAPAPAAAPPPPAPPPGGGPAV
jgi:hypothetical protein